MSDHNQKLAESIYEEHIAPLRKEIESLTKQRDEAIKEVSALRSGITEILAGCGEISDFKEQLDDLLTTG